MEYEVGTRIISVYDESRTEEFGKKKGPRAVNARLYYPANVTNEDVVIMPNKIMGVMHENAPMLEGKWPLITYSHGYGAYVECNNLLCCKLAKEGYVVLAVGHAYECEEVVMEDGNVIKMDKSIAFKTTKPFIKGTIETFKIIKKTGTNEEQYARFFEYQKKYSTFMWGRLEQWACDVKAIMAVLKERYGEYLDLAKGYGATGHSFGGNLAYYLCQNDEDCCCGANIDGGIFGDYTGQIMTKPFLQICNPMNVPVETRVLMDTTAEVEVEVFEGITHNGFTDLKFFSKSKALYGKLPAEDMSKRLISLHINFFNKHLK